MPNSTTFWTMFDQPWAVGTDGHYLVSYWICRVQNAAKSSTIRYWLKGGVRCPATGKVTVGLASHWPCVTDFSGLSSTYGSRGRPKEWKPGP